MNNKNNGGKKSHLLLIGSFLVFVGIVVLSYNHLLDLRNQIFSDMLISMYNNDDNSNKTKKTQEVQIQDIKNLDDGIVNTEQNINYDKYLGILSIPKIGLKRGFYNIDSNYNNVDYNVTLVQGSTMPDVAHGNLILMGHSGNGYAAYFANLYRLNNGDTATVTYNGINYQYKLVTRYDVDKTGKVKINRNYDRTTLTIITCTRNDDYHQTVYIFELVS